MLITVFGACFTASADGFGLIKVKATFMGIIPITNAEVWGEGENERYDSYYAAGIYTILVPFGKGFLSDPLPGPQSKDVNVKIKTKRLGSQSEMVYELEDSEEVWVNFSFGFGPRSHPFPYDWLQNYPLLMLLYQLLVRR